MSQYPVTFDNEQSFDTFLGKLQLTTRRLRQSEDPSPDNRPLDDRERRALDIITKQVQRQLARKSGDSGKAAEAIIQETIDVMGMRGYLNLYLVEPQIMGVSYKWFVINALVSLIIFIITNNFMVLFFTAPVVHAIGYIICQPIIKRQRKESIKKLLGEL